MATMVPLKFVNKKTLADVNKHLAALQTLTQHCDQAIEAGIPGMDVFKEQCADAINRLNRFKAVYFPMET